MDTLFHDLRYAFSQLRKAPGFTLTAVLTLALGIGDTGLYGVMSYHVARHAPAKSGSAWLCAQLD